MRSSSTRPVFNVLTLALIVLGFLQVGRVGAQDARIFIMKGDSLLRLEKPQRAVDQFDEAIKADPSANSYLARARAWYMMDRMDRFLLDVEQALRKDSTSANAHYQRALYAMRSADIATCELHATRAIDLTTSSSQRSLALVLRGEARADLKRNALAIADLEEGTEGAPSDPAVLRLLGRLYDQAGRHEDALRTLEKLCVLEPGEVGHWSNRGFELTALGRNEEALKMIQQALEIDKDEPVALSNRAYLYMLLDRDKEAWSDVERSLRFYPSNAYALRTRAMLRIRKGDREKACDDLTLAKALGGVPEVDALIKANCDTSASPKKK